MEPIAVPVGACRCPDKPHDEDIVYLAPELGMEAGLAVEAAMAETTGAAQTLAVSLALVRYNIVSWTFTGPEVEGEREPIGINRWSIEAMLPYARGGELVANKCADLYMSELLGPLGKRLRSVSQPSRTNGQTRPILASRNPSRRKRSGSSSQAASAGKP